MNHERLMIATPGGDEVVPQFSPSYSGDESINRKLLAFRIALESMVAPPSEIKASELQILSLEDRARAYLGVTFGNSMAAELSADAVVDLYRKELFIPEGAEDARHSSSTTEQPIVFTNDNAQVA